MIPATDIPDPEPLDLAPSGDYTSIDARQDDLSDLASARKQTRP
jgi:hypothetical protein